MPTLLPLHIATAITMMDHLSDEELESIFVEAPEEHDEATVRDARLAWAWRREDN
tara:strand:- start:1477 stop:1641 length:165 start_codon:yes stop_codon:yes gene_type:complete